MTKPIKEQLGVYTLDQARKILRLGRNAAYQAIAIGEIPHVRIGKKILIPRLALEQLLGDAAAGKRAD